MKRFHVIPLKELLHLYTLRIAFYSLWIFLWIEKSKVLAMFGVILLIIFLYLSLIHERIFYSFQYSEKGIYVNGKIIEWKDMDIYIHYSNCDIVEQWKPCATLIFIPKSMTKAQIKVWEHIRYRLKYGAALGNWEVGKLLKVGIPTYMLNSHFLNKIVFSDAKKQFGFDNEIKFLLDWRQEKGSLRLLYEEVENWNQSICNRKNN